MTLFFTLIWIYIVCSVITDRGKLKKVQTSARTAYFLLYALSIVYIVAFILGVDISIPLYRFLIISPVVWVNRFIDTSMFG